MIDSEVDRLRRLRGSALQLRAVVRSLAARPAFRGDVLLAAGGCAAWRIARAITGRLRAHPHERYQRDASAGTLLKNSIVATSASLAATDRVKAMSVYSEHLKRVLRELENTRAMTWAADLSESFGRSQLELKALLGAVHCETHDCTGKQGRKSVRSPALGGMTPRPRLSPDVHRRTGTTLAEPAIRGTDSAGDWPFIAI